MMVKSYSLDRILKKRKSFSLDNPYYAGDDFKDTIKGEKKAYDEMLSDTNETVGDFYCKYLHKLAQCYGCLDNSDETIAYGNSIEEILELINPYYRVVSRMADLEACMTKIRVSEFSMKSIIENKVVFIKSNTNLDKIESRKYNEGIETAYIEMSSDLGLEISEFIGKFENIFKENNAEVENKVEKSAYEPMNEDDEKKIGYCNAIMEILEILDPKYRFGIEE